MTGTKDNKSNITPENLIFILTHGLMGESKINIIGTK